MSDLWPGEKRTAADAPTEVKKPPPSEERTQADSIRQQASHLTRSEQGERFVTLAILEVSAAIDRLTAELRKGS